jgi:hypothetical protein
LARFLLKEGALSRGDLDYWRVKSLSTTGESYQRCFPSLDLLFYSVCLWIWGLEQRRPKYQGTTQPGKFATQPVLGDGALEGKEIDLVLFYIQLLGLWRLASSLIIYLGRYLHAQLIYFIYIIPNLQIYCMEISYYLNKGQI